MARECGECDVCCVYFPARALSKPSWKPCRYLRADRSTHRCTRHGTAEMLAVCSDFECGWLAGLGEESDRPDLSGVCVVPQDGTNHICVVEEGRDVSATVARLSRAVVGKQKTWPYEKEPT